MTAEGAVLAAIIVLSGIFGAGIVTGLALAALL